MTRLHILPLLVALVGCVGPSDRVVAELALDVPADALTSVRLTQGIGDTEIIGDPDASAVQLSVLVRGPDLDDSQDDEVMDDLIFDLEACGDRACARTDLSDAHIRYTLDTTLILPSDLALTVRDHLGDLWIRDVAELDVEDGSGDLYVEGIAGPTRIQDDLGDTTLVGILGDVDVRDGSGDLRIDDVVGDVRVNDDLGDIDVRHIDGDVEIDDGSGDIFVDGVTGDVVIHDDLGDIFVRGVDGEVDVASDTLGDVRIDQSGNDRP